MVVVARKVAAFVRLPASPFPPVPLERDHFLFVLFPLPPVLSISLLAGALAKRSRELLEDGANLGDVGKPRLLAMASGSYLGDGIPHMRSLSSKSTKPTNLEDGFPAGSWEPWFR